MCISLTLGFSIHSIVVTVVTGSTCWLGGRDSNPDSQIQSLESYHWTTSQRRIRIYGSLTFKSTEPFKRGGLMFQSLRASAGSSVFRCGDFKKKYLRSGSLATQNSHDAGNARTC